MAKTHNNSANPTIIRDKCGSRNGYQTHSYYKEIPCEPCTDANASRYRKWYDSRKESERARIKKYGQENPQKMKMYRRIRRARQKNVESEKYLESDILHIYGIECHICQETIDLTAPRQVGTTGWERGLHLDHVIPLSKGGPDTVDNVRPAHGICNVKKNDRDLESYVESTALEEQSLSEASLDQVGMQQ
jgi:5-methylcytosine-specific restriction endonuclease McrA